MIKEEEYIKYLKAIISCIDHGDYYSVKEFSNLELKRVKESLKERENKRDDWLNEIYYDMFLFSFFNTKNSLFYLESFYLMLLINLIKKATIK